MFGVGISRQAGARFKKNSGGVVLLQQEHSSARSMHGFFAPSTESLNVLAYKSVAATTPTDSEIQHLFRAAQCRNKAEGLTGVLLYDRGSYFQWLEGPAEALGRVWQSISHDARHDRVRVLRDEPIGDRVFEGWDLRIVQGPAGAVDQAVAALQSSPVEFKRVVEMPQSVIDRSLGDLFSAVVIPRLCEVHGRHAYSPWRRERTAANWHAERDCGAKLAQQLISSRPEDSRILVDSLLSEGASLNALYHEVFEPAQLYLGQLADDDKCDDFLLTLGLARLHLEIRRANAALPTDHQLKPHHSILLCAQPHEPHCVGQMMSSELFDRRGWSVDCEFPTDNQALSELVHTRWFDVLKVSQSGSLRRDHQLTSLRTTIDSARSASLNPSLLVMVDGRTFVERPQVYRAVHANAMSTTAVDTVSIAERMLAVSQSVGTMQVSVS